MPGISLVSFGLETSFVDKVHKVSNCYFSVCDFHIKKILEGSVAIDPPTHLFVFIFLSFFPLVLLYLFYYLLSPISVVLYKYSERSLPAAIAL